MNSSRFFLFALVLAIMTGFKTMPEDEIELTCVKNLKSTNTCHFNFTISGVRYRFVDHGCKYNGNKQEVIKKAKEGSLALAKDWKIQCPEPKDTKGADSTKASGF